MPGSFRSSPGSAGAVIAGALVQARAEGTSQIREEHLLAALLADPASRLLLSRLGEVEEEAVRADVREARRRGGLTVSEQHALAGLGINVGEIAARAEAQLGEGALDATRAPALRRRRASVSPGVAAVLSAARRQRAARRDRAMTARHLVLGTLAAPGLLADALAARGITLATALEAMEGDDPAAAP